METAPSGSRTESKCTNEITRMADGTGQLLGGGPMGRKCMFELTPTA